MVKKTEEEKLRCLNCGEHVEAVSWILKGRCNKCSSAFEQGKTIFADEVLKQVKERSSFRVVRGEAGKQRIQFNQRDNYSRSRGLQAPNIISRRCKRIYQAVERGIRF